MLLTDYAENLLREADAGIKKAGLGNVKTAKADLYKLRSLGRRFDCAVCIRVMHHVEDVPAFFAEVNSVLRPGGAFVLEFANKQNILEILRFLAFRPNLGPFSMEPGRRGDGLYYNFHPIYVEELLEAAGFEIEERLSVSLFRSRALKKMFGNEKLLAAEKLLQSPLGRLHPGPSVFLLARKVSEAG